MAVIKEEETSTMERVVFGHPEEEWRRAAMEFERKLMGLTGIWEDALLPPPPRPVEMPPTPSRHKVALSESAPDADYIALATDVGFTCPAILQSRLEAFFAAEFIEAYPMDKVAAYMDALAQNEGAKAGRRMGWCWRPLRARDSASIGTIIGAAAYNAAVYNKPVPQPVLLTVKRVGEAFPEVGFFISDLMEVPKPDPFLMVTAPGIPRYVIERWDEPTFRS